MKIKEIIILCLLGILLISLVGCQQPGGNSTGSEYMPDMAHSVAYEANYYNYYYNNTWGSEEDYHEMAKPREPVAGTVPRSFSGTNASADRAMASGTSTHNGITYTQASSAPYYYGDSDEERERATAEIIKNPYPITDNGLASAKANYDIYCGICHGEKGDGNGYLVRDDGGKYPVAPANFLNEEFMAASNGRYYHAIIYGKNMMSGYTDKLSYEERWQVIHYIRSLQAKEAKMKYNEYENTLNTVDTPAGELVAHEVSHSENENQHGHEDDHHDENDHSH